MVTEISDDFDLKKIADSGQCFRWTETEDGYEIIAGSHWVRIREESRGNEEGRHCLELSCSRKEFETFWRQYFDLGLDYSSVRRRIDPEKDPYLYRASACGTGIRILNQDPWETLITFIVSQRKNIPAIRLSVDKLCRMAGTRLAEEQYSFPGPEQMCSLSGEQLAECGLGYRAKYVHRAAEDAADGRIDFGRLKGLPDDELKEELMALYGVGIKVANCVMLFGFHRLDSFPEDVWILRLLEEEYPGGFPFDAYKPYNGIMQQYLFWYRRTVQKK
ncbi:DNA-3-methyladenine glycosylase family protein [Bilifractor sp. LCP21S3_A7]|uniref:DNA-3-methyladenine glycosylase family protein n=1 Tax=Bilifractor sp. LCP21S3_A7 TaxID=3438738 RepID=UPI003F92FC7D